MSKNNKESKKPGNAPVITDDRFKSVHNDPRFKTTNLKNLKIKVDDRFSEKVLKKLNAGATGKKVKIDRFGRKVKNDDSTEKLRKFYEHEEKEDESKSESENADDESDNASDSKESDEDSDEESDEEDMDNSLKLSAAEQSILDARSKKSKQSKLKNKDVDSSDVSSSDSDSDSDSFAEFSGEDDDDLSDDEIEAKPEEGEPTSSFAVVNMDWDNIRAVDLMATFSSFIPKGGIIKSVSIYPSEFGKEQMQKEETEGPPKDLFKSKKQKKVESDSDSEIDEEELKTAEGMEKAARKLYTEEDGTDDYDSKALRRYQLQRLRYYYAIVQCDSVQTASNIYRNCDSTEFESTANMFDLRYVPEDMDFDENEPKDVCTEIPSSYNPNSSFVTDALQHSKVKLTWDETPKERLAIASKQFSQREIDDMDFKAYLASDSDESGSEKEDNKDKYKNLIGNKFSSNFDKKAENSEDDIDMEITFNPGLDENAIAEQQKREEELNTIQEYKQKEKERRKKRMSKFKETQAADKENTDESKKTKGKPKVDENSKAQLELLMMDEKDDAAKPEHFNMKDVLKQEKLKNKKNKKRSKTIDTEMTQDNFEADLNDPRFKEIFENHEFAIDPTSSEFKKTQTMKKILKERSKRKVHEDEDKPIKKRKDVGQTPTNGSELNNLVNKMKNKNLNKKK